MPNLPTYVRVKGVVQVPSGWRKLRKTDRIRAGDLHAYGFGWHDIGRCVEGLRVGGDTVIRKKGYNGRNPPVRYRKGHGILIPPGFRMLPKGEITRKKDRWPCDSAWVTTLLPGRPVGAMPYIRRTRTKAKNS